MDLTTITVAQFKTRFYRDFSYQNQNPSQTAIRPPEEGEPIVQDIDITNAFTSAQAVINVCLFGGEAELTEAYLLLSAHFLCVNINNSLIGIKSNGSSAFAVASRTVGSVSEAYEIPEAYKQNPVLMQYAQTAYGQQYLMFVTPKLIGNLNPVWGGAQPAI